MAHFMIAEETEYLENAGVIPLKLWTAGPDTPVYSIDQSAPNVIAMSMFGMWSFNQEDTGQFVADLRAFAEFLDRGVAR